MASATRCARECLEFCGDFQYSTFYFCPQCYSRSKNVKFCCRTEITEEAFLEKTDIYCLTCKILIHSHQKTRVAPLDVCLNLPVANKLVSPKLLWCSLNSHMSVYYKVIRHWNLNNLMDSCLSVYCVTCNELICIHSSSSDQHPIPPSAKIKTHILIQGRLKGVQ